MRAQAVREISRSSKSILIALPLFLAGCDAAETQTQPSAAQTPKAAERAVVSLQLGPGDNAALGRNDASLPLTKAQRDLILARAHTGDGIAFQLLTTHELELGEDARSEINRWYAAGNWAAKLPTLIFEGRESRFDQAQRIAREIRRGSIAGSIQGGPVVGCEAGGAHPLCRWAAGASEAELENNWRDLLAKEPDPRIRDVFAVHDCDSSLVDLTLKYRLDDPNGTACKRWLVEGFEKRDDRFDDYAMRALFLARRIDSLGIKEEQRNWLSEMLTEDERKAVDVAVACDTHYEDFDCQHALYGLKAAYPFINAFLRSDDSCQSVDRVLEALFERAEYNGVAIYRAGACLLSGRGTIRDRRRGLALLRYGALRGAFGGPAAYARALLEPPYAEVQRAYFWALLADDEKLTAAIAAKLAPSTADAIEEAARKWAGQRGNRWTAAAVDYLGIARVDELPTAEAESSAPDGSSSGTAFVAAPRIVATAAHVVAGCSRASTAWGEATLIQADESTDLALLRVDITPEALPLRVKRPAMGEQIVVLGYPIQGLGAVGLNASTGVVSALTGPRGMSRMIQITAQVQPGSSGGPVLDGAGQVVGVVVSTLEAEAAYRQTGALPQNVNFAVRAAALQEALDAAGIAVADGGSADRTEALSAEALVAQARSSVSQIRCSPDAPADR